MSNYLIETKKAATAIANIANDVNLSQFDRELWLMSIAAVAIENVRPDIRKMFFDAFEPLKDMVDKECDKF